MKLFSGLHLNSFFQFFFSYNKAREKKQKPLLNLFDHF